MLLGLSIADKCKEDLGCYEERLQDENVKVVEKAALLESDLMRGDYFNALMDFLAPVPVVGEAAFGLRVGKAVVQPQLVPTTQSEWDNLAWSVYYLGSTGLGF